MKKYFFAAASAVLALSSCSNEIEQVSTLPSTNVKKEIKVSTYTPEMTRALTYDEQLKENGFWMIARTATESAESGVEYQDLVNHKYNYSETDGTGVWSPATEGADEKLYWPTDPYQTVDFFAFYDAKGNTNAFSIINNNSMEILAEGGTAQVDGESDILAATTSTSLSEHPDGSVALEFNHILAQITATITAGTPNYLFRLDSLTISAPVKGSYYFKDNIITYEENTTTIDYSLNISESFLEAGTTSEESNTILVMPGNELRPCKVTVVYYVGVTEESMEKVRLTQEIYPSAGFKNLLDIKLSAAAKEIKVAPTVKEWNPEQNNITVE